MVILQEYSIRSLNAFSNIALISGIDQQGILENFNVQVKNAHVARTLFIYIQLHTSNLPFLGRSQCVTLIL